MDRPRKASAPDRRHLVAAAAAGEEDPHPQQQQQQQQRRWLGAENVNTGIMDERVLMLVFQSMNWDPHVLSRAACVSRRLRAVAKRVLWRELCYTRAPKMVAALASFSPGDKSSSSGGSRNSNIGGGWHALAKLFFYCSGCSSTQHFRLTRPSPGHFVPESRFSKTSGRSFLPKRCRGDLLYVSDPCEHSIKEEDDDVGVYRGVFRGFMRSRTRAVLVERRVQLDARVRCPYCGARVWSMTAARLVPRSASRRLGAHHGCLDYFVCVNGHLHGNCWLTHLSTDDDDDLDVGDDADEQSEDPDPDPDLDPCPDGGQEKEEEEGGGHVGTC